MVHSLLLILFFDMLCLAFIGKIPNVNHTVLYGCLLIIFVLTVWKIIMVKKISIEISEHILSIKYNHPLSRKLNFPVLEVPLHKVTSCKIEKGTINYFLLININTKRGTKRFCYNLGILSQEQCAHLKKALDFIKLYTKNETGL